MQNKKKHSRREFVKKTAATTAGLSIGLNTLTAAEAMRIRGANDRIRVGFIGTGNRGTELMDIFRENKDVEVGALCDVYEPYILRDRAKVDKRYLATKKIPQMGEDFGEKVKRYKDFRRLLEQKDIEI